MLISVFLQTDGFGSGVRQWGEADAASPRFSSLNYREQLRLEDEPPL